MIMNTTKTFAFKLAHYTSLAIDAMNGRNDGGVTNCLSYRIARRAARNALFNLRLLRKQNTKA